MMYINMAIDLQLHSAQTINMQSTYLDGDMYVVGVSYLLASMGRKYIKQQ